MAEKWKQIVKSIINSLNKKRKCSIWLSGNKKIHTQKRLLNYLYKHYSVFSYIYVIQFEIVSNFIFFLTFIPCSSLVYLICFLCSAFAVPHNLFSMQNTLSIRLDSMCTCNVLSVNGWRVFFSSSSGSSRSRNANKHIHLLFAVVAWYAFSSLLPSFVFIFLFSLLILVLSVCVCVCSFHFFKWKL